MNFDPTYTNQVDLLLDVLPIINQFDCFALKGGTAINLFIRDMPRLSVDIDLAYLPIEPRDIFLKNYTSELLKMKKLIEEQNLKVKEHYTNLQQLSKLFVYGQNAEIKIEPNLVVRGSVFECEKYDLCKRAQDQFLKFSSAKTLSFADLYGGKICAALDRYHPRDLFDIKLLFETHGFTDKVRQAFIIYLASSRRPMHELLDPNRKLDLERFELLCTKEFSGMTDSASISSKDLIKVREHLIKEILEEFTQNEKMFLISLKSNVPDWSLIPIKGIENLPSLQWKLENIKKIPEPKKKTSLDKLKSILYIQNTV